MCEDLSPPDTDINNAYTAFQRKLIGLAKKCIPRGFRSPYIPSWDKKCEELANEHAKAKSLDEKRNTANKLLDYINNHRRSKWVSTVEETDMKHSSRKAWSTINKHTGKKNTSPNPNSISANAVAPCHLKNAKFQQPNKEFTRLVNRELRAEWNSPSVDQDLCGDFTADELHSAISLLKPGKAPGPENLHLEFLIHLEEKCQDWLLKLLSSCLHLKKIPRICKLAKVVPVLKPNKPKDSLSDCNGTRTHNHLVCKRTLNHLAKLT